MENRVYYGEYSLKHWIDLILTKNIILPEYQRKFVWKPEQVKNLIESIKTGEFVPPVTIGSAEINGENKNLIIDGQQRLTSLLLFYLNVYPKKSKFIKKTIDLSIENENDDIDDNETIEWKFDELLKEYPNINKTLYDKLYEPQISCDDISDDILEKYYLGFAYIIPEGRSAEQSRYYSSVFKHINESGNKLSKEESRRALYFLDSRYTNFFDTKTFDVIRVQQQTVERKVDFVRYAAMLAQYNKCKNADRIAIGYGATEKREDYYAEYINSVIENKDSELFGNFEVIFPDGSYNLRLQRIHETISAPIFPKIFNSIIDADFFLFGLIFYSLFEDKTIQFSDELKNNITKAIESAKKGKVGAKRKQSPNALNFTQQRIKKSLDLYKDYASTL